MSTTIPKRDEEHERLLGVVFNLSPSQSSILSCLIRSTVVSRQNLIEFTEVKSPIKIFVSHTRKKLKAFGLDIKSKSGAGYWLEQDDKNKIGALVDVFVKG